LTPAGFLGEMQKAPDGTAFFAVHLRGRCRDQVMRELLEPKLANLQIAKFGKPYAF